VTSSIWYWVRPLQLWAIQLSDNDGSLLCADLLLGTFNLQWTRARTSLTLWPLSRMVSLLLTSHDHATLVTWMIFPWINVGSCCMPMGVLQQLLLEWSHITLAIVEPWPRCSAFLLLMTAQLQLPRHQVCWNYIVLHRLHNCLGPWYAPGCIVATQL